MNEKESLIPGNDARFARTAILAGVGMEGLAKLRAAKVLAIGAGGLGCAALSYLAAGGVGAITVLESDAVEASNLNRQILYRESDIGTAKAKVAAARLRELNPACAVTPVVERVDRTKLDAILFENKFAVVLDCTDNFETRFAIADACLAAKVPLVIASAQGFGGQALVQLPGEGNPTYRDLIAEVPDSEANPSPEETGVLGPVAGLMGCIQATEALKILLGIGTPLAREFLNVNALRGSYRTFPFT